MQACMRGRSRSGHGVADVCHVRRRLCLDELELRQADTLEEARAAAEQYRRDVEVEPVEEARAQDLRRDARAATNTDVLTARGLARLLHGRLDAVVHEG